MIEKLKKFFKSRSDRSIAKTNRRHETLRAFGESLAEGVGSFIADGVTRGMY